MSKYYVEDFKKRANLSESEKDLMLEIDRLRGLTECYKVEFRRHKNKVICECGKKNYS